MFQAVSNKTAFAAVEREVLEFWKRHRTFERSLEARRGAPEFVFYDGPPFATGLPHYGHLLAGTIKDIVPRYQTMRGRYVERRFGWDCHGLPVEYEVEQELKIGGKREIEALGVGAFNERCRGIVLRYTREWREIVTRMGRWVDFDRDYKTMDPGYMESIWWVFKTLWDRGLIYEGYRVVWYCPRCATPLSNFETNQGYEDTDDPAVTVRFAVRGEPQTYLLAWTTTPWTLPANMALAVGAEVPYVRVRDGGAQYWLARDRLPAYAKSLAGGEVTATAAGRELAGLRYEPLFPYYAAAADQGAFRVILADFVSTEDGTGVVHIAPAFGEDDARVGQAEGLPAPCPVDAECRFTAEVPDYAGRYVKETDADILRRLKAENKLLQQGTIRHPYPHCWRCDTELISRAISAWYVRVERIRDRLLAANARTRWVPAHLRDGRFGKWLEGARDWNISRNRYWGTPLPVWRSADGRETVCLGSIAELEERSGRKVTDLHKHFVDQIELPSREGRGPLRRVPEVLDCWFESGAMPYAQAHYPFENREHFEKHFPADFIAEGLDQTRGWFYTLLVLSTALFDRPAFANVIVNGLVLAEDGRKMSKRLKNYPDPAYMLDTYGADALRLYLVASPVVRAEDLRFSEEGVKQLMRQILIPLWNAYSFFVTYANIDGWAPAPAAAGAEAAPPRSEHVLDRWIRSSLASLAQEVTAALDEYDLQRAVRPFLRFIEDLTNWYIRRSRRRFWKSKNDADKTQAYETLHRVLLDLARIAAPFIPFLSEAIYRNLRAPDMPESVHLCDYPTGDGRGRDPELEAQMADVQTAVGLGRQLRARGGLKVRQPLPVMHVVSRSAEARRRVERLADIVREELNVKRLEFGEHETALAILKAKADFKRLGPRLGAAVKPAAAAIAALDSAAVERLAGGETLRLTVNGAAVEVGPQDVLIERAPRPGLMVAASGALVVAIETALSDELLDEGLAREFVNRVQNMRKSAGMQVTDRIRVSYCCEDDLQEAVAAHAEYICRETLALALERADLPPAGGTDWELNGSPCVIRVERAGAAG